MTIKILKKKKKKKKRFATFYHRLLELEGKHEEDMKTVVEQNEKLESLEQQVHDDVCFFFL